VTLGADTRHVELNLLQITGSLTNHKEEDYYCLLRIAFGNTSATHMEEIAESWSDHILFSPIRELPRKALSFLPFDTQKGKSSELILSRAAVGLLSVGSVGLQCRGRSV
jgi:hypothetical protein